MFALPGAGNPSIIKKNPLEEKNESE